MKRTLSIPARREIVKALRERYSGGSKNEKAKILDEFTSVAGYHRKYAVRLLGGEGAAGRAGAVCSRRIYDETVREALVVAWEAADRICGKRLRAALPLLIDAMERHNRIRLDSGVRRWLLSASAATLDRLLAPIRREAKPSRRRRPAPNKASGQVAIRTFADWNEPAPGHLEIDFVEHNVGSTGGAFLRTLVASDVCSGWTECVPRLAREQSLVVEALQVVRRQAPFGVLGIDSDNDSAFINDTLLDYCRVNGIELTRSRAHRKNDQAWVEQKNGAIVRRFVGYDRFARIVAGQALAHLYQAVRLYVNHFQPSFKLLAKERNGSRVRKFYDRPATPCARLLADPRVDAAAKERLFMDSRLLDPVALLHRIREQQAALAALSCPADAATGGPGRKSLEQFIAQLGQMWRLGEVRPTHRGTPPQARTWRTRKDPFEAVWPEVLAWLQGDPDSPAKLLFQRLQGQYPGHFSAGQLRTLQRRVRQWRQVVARELVYAGLDGAIASFDASPIGSEPPPGNGETGAL